MKSTLWSVIIPLVVLSLLISATGCQSSAPQTGPAAKEEVSATEAGTKMGAPYKIGALLDITGGASTLGIPERNTIEMLHREVDAAGGVQGPDGLMHPVELVIYDGESDETKTVLAAKKLIEEDQVLIILGPSQSGTTLAIMDTVQKAGVPLIAIAASVQIVEPVAERKWIFKTPWLDRHFAAAQLGYLKSQGMTKVAWLSINNAFGDSGKLEFEKQAPDYDVTIVSSEKFEMGDTDMSAQLTKIRGSDAQALVICSILPGAAIVTKNAYDLGLEIPIVHCNAAAGPTFIELATAQAAEGVIVPAGKVGVAEQLPASDPQKEVLMKYLKDYRAAYDTQPDQFGGSAQDAFKLALQAMEKAGPDRAAIRDQLEKIQGFVGTNGIFDYSPSNHVGVDERGLVLIEVRDGKWQLVEP